MKEIKRVRVKPSLTGMDGVLGILQNWERRFGVLPMDEEMPKRGSLQACWWLKLPKQHLILSGIILGTTAPKVSCI